MTAGARFVVVGGGVVAAAAAYQLARQGAAVTIVEGDQRGIATNAGAGIAARPGRPAGVAAPAGCQVTPAWSGPETG